MKRVLMGAFWVLIVAMFIAVILIAIPIILLCAFIHFIEQGVKSVWHGLPRHRRALRLAQAAFETRMPGYRVNSWHIARRDREKCFIMATLTGSVMPPSYWLVAVWDGEDQVDELGTWQFHWGIRLHHAVSTYETAAPQARPGPSA